MVSFILTLIILIFVHEMGHYVAARACGIRSIVFSIGFGPTLFRYTDKRSTQWRLSLIPLGGYVRFEEDSFYYAKLWEKALTTAAGPAANILFAFLVSTSVVWWNNPDASIIQAVLQGAKIVWMIISLTFSALADFSPDHLSGPIGIAKIYNQSSDYIDAFLISIVLSVGIAIFNILPVPGLDGGHLALYAVESVTGKTVNEKLQGVLAVIGFGALLTLTLYVTCKDIFG